MYENNVLNDKTSANEEALKTANTKALKNVPLQGNELKFSAVNSSALAFLGDAVYELYVRKHVLESGKVKTDLLNRLAVRYVRAESQALVFDAVYVELDEDEKGVARRGKNHRISSMPHNVSTIIYKKATGFEALIGYLFLEENVQRLEFIIKKAFSIIEAKPACANRYIRRLNETGEITE